MKNAIFFFTAISVASLKKRWQDLVKKIDTFFIMLDTMQAASFENTSEKKRLIIRLTDMQTSSHRFDGTIV